MITEEIQKSLNKICNAYAYIGEFEAKPPFAVHMLESNPINTKEGILGFSHQVTIILVTLTIAEAESLSPQIKNAVLGISHPDIYQILTGGQNREFDPKNGAFYTEHSFEITAKSV